MDLKKLLVFLFALGQIAAQGTEVIWLKLEPTFSYKDITTACSNTPFLSVLYFGAEVSGLQVTRAVLRESNDDLLSEKVGLLGSEMTGIKLYRDKHGQLWVQELPLSERLFAWVFAHAGKALDECRPPLPIVTVVPSPFSYRFDVAGMEEGVFSVNSQMGMFSGRRKDGGAYAARLQWNQRQFGSTFEEHSR